MDMKQVNMIDAKLLQTLFQAFNDVIFFTCTIWLPLSPAQLHIDRST